MSIQTTLMTVEEFRRLPEPTDGTTYELHHGELVRVTNPKYNHQICALRILFELTAQLEERGLVFPECAFRALPEYDARRADVAFVSFEKHRKALKDNEVFGAPDLVVEVLSPSNTIAEMDERQALCFANGCLEFWLVDPKRWTVRVTSPQKHVRWYRVGESIPLGAFGGGEIALDRIFRFGDPGE